MKALFNECIPKTRLCFLTCKSHLQYEQSEWRTETSGLLSFLQIGLSLNTAPDFLQSTRVTLRIKPGKECCWLGWRQSYQGSWYIHLRAVVGWQSCVYVCGMGRGQCEQAMGPRGLGEALEQGAVRAPGMEHYIELTRQFTLRFTLWIYLHKQVLNKSIQYKLIQVKANVISLGRFELCPSLYTCVWGALTGPYRAYISCSHQKQTWSHVMFHSCMFQYTYIFHHSSDYWNGYKSLEMTSVCGIHVIDVCIKWH